MLHAALPASQATAFMIDSGCIYHGSGDLPAETFVELRRRQLLQPLGKSYSETFSGTTEELIGALPWLRLTSFTIKTPHFGATPLEHGILGTGFLSRFIVTFDFANDALYLRPSKHFNRPDRTNDTGLRILREAKGTYVAILDAKSLGERCGFQRDDVLMHVDGRAAESMTMHQLRGLLMEPRALAVRVRRGERERTLTLRR